MPPIITFSFTENRSFFFHAGYEITKTYEAQFTDQIREFNQLTNAYTHAKLTLAEKFASFNCVI